MTYLLDTCILSKLRKIKKHPDKKLEEWVLKHTENQYYISVLTVGEIQAGISKLKDETHKAILEDWLFGELIPRFNGRMLDINQKVAHTWGIMIGQNSKKGIILPTIDSLLAATALQHGLILVTDNTKDFIFSGVSVFNPSA